MGRLKSMTGPNRSGVGSFVQTMGYSADGTRALTARGSNIRYESWEDGLGGNAVMLTQGGESIVDSQRGFAGGVVHGATFGWQDPSWANSCSWASFAGAVSAPLPPVVQAGRSIQAGRAARREYVAAAREAREIGYARVMGGGGPPAEAAAKEASDARYVAKVAARAKTPLPARKYMERRNTRRYGDPIGKRYEDYADAYVDSLEIINKAGKTNPFWDRLGGVR